MSAKAYSTQLHRGTKYVTGYWVDATFIVLTQHQTRPRAQASCLRQQARKPQRNVIVRLVEVRHRR